MENRYNRDDSRGLYGTGLSHFLFSLPLLSLSLCF